MRARVCNLAQRVHQGGVDTTDERAGFNNADWTREEKGTTLRKRDLFRLLLVLAGTSCSSRDCVELEKELAEAKVREAYVVDLALMRTNTIPRELIPYLTSAFYSSNHAPRDSGGMFSYGHVRLQPVSGESLVFHTVGTNRFSYGNCAFTIKMTNSATE